MFAPEETARKPRFWLPWLACLAASIAAAAGYELWTLAREPRWAELYLDARPAAGGLEIHWDRTAPLVANASRAILLITDGPTRKSFELTAAELRSGKFSYSSSARDLLIRLHIYGDGLQTSGDSLRFVSAREPAREPPAPPPAQPDADRAVVRPAAAVVAAVAVVPPTVVHEVQPPIPPGIRARIEDRVVVPVDVEVSLSGKVTGSVAQGDGDGLYRYLANQAAMAARLWRFSPAKSKDGRPLAAKKTIYFDFAP